MVCAGQSIAAVHDFVFIVHFSVRWKTLSFNSSIRFLVQQWFIVVSASTTDYPIEPQICLLLPIPSVSVNHNKILTYKNIRTQEKTKKNSAFSFYSFDTSTISVSKSLNGKVNCSNSSIVNIDPSNSVHLSSV